MDGQTPRKSLPRRIVRALAFLAILLVLVIAGLPWLLAVPTARKAVVSAVNRVLAPSKIEAKGLSAGWISSVKVSGLTLTNREGKTLINARQASLDRGLIALAWSPSKLGVITVEGAAVDIERKADGSIDLVDALVAPAPEGSAPPPVETTPEAGSGTDVTLRVVKGSLRLKTPELAQPIEAEAMDLEVRYPSAAGQKLSWKLRLSRPPGGDESQTLGIDGDYDHQATGAADLSLAVQGRSWPLMIAGASVGADLAAKTRLDGVFRASKTKGLWASSGDAVLLGLDAEGPALAGDRLKLDRVNGIWDLSQSPEGWAIRRVDLTSPVAVLKGKGGFGEVPSGRIEATVDLAALAKQMPRALRLREGLTLERGGIQATVELSGDAKIQHGVVDAKLTELVARDPTKRFALRDSATLAAKASRTSDGGLALETLTIKTAFLNVNGSGDLEHGLNVSGTLDLAAIQTQFRDLLDFGAVELAGMGRMAGDFRKSGSVQGPSYVARYAAEVKGLNLVGLTAEPIARDLARFDASVTGPAGPSGTPTSWENLRVNLKSSQDSVALAATTKEGVTAISASASVPWKVLERDALIDAKFGGRWREVPAAVDIQELRLGLRPADPKLAADGTIILAVKGRLDLDADTLTLSPLPVASGGALAIAPEGLTWKGLRKTPTTAMAAKVRLVGDLNAIDRAQAVWRGGAAYGLGGALAVQLGIDPGEEGLLNLALDVQTPDLSRSRSDNPGRQSEGPFRLAYQGHYQPDVDRLTVEALSLASRYVTLDASGKIDEPTGGLVADLQGVLTPHWEAVSALAAEMVEPNLKLTGGSRPFRIKGSLAAGSLATTLKGLDAELGLDLASADAFGLKLGPAPIVLTFGNRGATIAPISTTLNGGQVELRPGLEVDEVRGIALTLAKGSSIENASVNDEVSGRVLRYVAPVLDKATQVNGKISMEIDQADIPLVGPDDHRLTLTGKLMFQDVVFAPGPFAGEILTLVGRPDSPGLKLSQPVQLSVADGKVIQKGLEIPIRRDVTIAMEGSVGFDQSLDLRASVPVTRAMLGLGQVAQMDELVNGTRVTLPIGGTVQHPRIDRRGLQVALKDLSKGVINRGLSRGASELLNRLGPPPEAGSDAPAGATGSAPRTLEGAASQAVKGLEKEVLRRLLPRGPGR